MTTAHEALRTGTRIHHAQVDDVFGRFDLSDAGSYRSFLEAHARAVVPIEWALGDPASPPCWRSRVSLLDDDLRALGGGLPPVVALDGLKGSGERAGMLYVIEGSRLGGGVLAGRVGPALPTSYLSAVHLKGEWMALLMAFDARAAIEPPEWMTDALDGAKRAFALFRDAVDVAPVRH
jgi:heme oxygenase